jgi:hypothetical protein
VNQNKAIGKFDDAIDVFGVGQYATGRTDAARWYFNDPIDGID